MNPIVENALNELIVSEKNNIAFFRQAAEMVHDDRTRQVFEHLACKGIGYLHVFSMIYLGSDTDNISKFLTKQPPDNNYPPYRALLAKDDSCSCEQQALELSLQEVHSSINLYTTLENAFRNPGICAIYRRALRKAYRYYEIIQEEYIRILGLFEAATA